MNLRASVLQNQLFLFFFLKTCFYWLFLLYLQSQNVIYRTMKKTLLTIIVLFSVLFAMGKTTYVPTYVSYIHIVTNGDTISATSNLSEQEMKEPTGMFRIWIDQEDVTHEKVKAIKRAKRIAGWMTFSAVLSGVSTAFSTNSLQYMVRSTNTQISAMLAGFYRANANAEQALAIDVWIENTTDKELMVCDMERGLTWWILPRQQMKLKLNNPDASSLRISDAKNEVVRYANVLAGSKLRKIEVMWEDDKYFIYPVYKENEIHKESNLIKYVCISKEDFTETYMNSDEFKYYKKNSNK